MSILITGMEMPERCAKCFLKQSCDKRIYMERRPDNCQLGYVPPHGRLIDADAFCEKVLEIVERQEYDDLYTKSLSVGAILREVVTELRGKGFDGFDNAPTIIPAEPCNDLVKPNNASTVIEAEGRGEA